MCGVVGAVSKLDAGKICFKALEKLEYRGYDSAGIAGKENGQLKLFKKQGFVCGIKDYCQSAKFDVAIAHTRWATHGIPCNENAHPILSCKKNFAIVHNGIIENFLPLKKSLMARGVVFESQTDTEVICNLMEFENGDVLTRLKQTCTKLIGSFAIALVCKSQEKIYVAKQSSPLFIGMSKSCNMVASDVLCFETGARVYELKDGEFAEISAQGVNVYDENLAKIVPNFEVLQFGEQESGKCGFSHFMSKEIHEIPLVVEKMICEYSNFNKIKNALCLLQGITHIDIIACGTAYHAGLYGAKLFREKLGVDARAHIASEFRYGKFLKRENSVAILVSQSGETADTLQAGELCKKYGYRVLTITNSKQSKMARSFDANLDICAGKEIGVASTKAYVAMLLMFLLLVGFLKNKDFDTKRLKNELSGLENLFEIDDKIIDIVSCAKRVFFIGRQYDNITALEGALKLKEITYKSAEGYPAGELKHGTLALIEPKTPTIVVSTNRHMHQKTMSGAEEIRSRGGVIILVAPKEFDKGCSDFQIEIPNVRAELGGIVGILPLQVLAYEVAVKMGFDPDKPRNLAKSVTVE